MKNRDKKSISDTRLALKCRSFLYGFGRCVSLFTFLGLFAKAADSTPLDWVPFPLVSDQGSSFCCFSVFHHGLLRQLRKKSQGTQASWRGQVRAMGWSRSQPRATGTQVKLV